MQEALHNEELADHREEEEHLPLGVMNARCKTLFKAGPRIQGDLFLVDRALPQEYEKVEAK